MHIWCKVPATLLKLTLLHGYNMLNWNKVMPKGIDNFEFSYSEQSYVVREQVGFKYLFSIVNYGIDC